MATELLPHHLDQFAARLEGTRYSLATGKLPHLDSEEARARLFGWDCEDLADKIVQWVSSGVIIACASTFVGSAVYLVWGLL